MKTFKLLGLAVLATFMLTACQKDDLTLSDSSVTLRTQEEPMMVPFKGNFTATPEGDVLIGCTLPNGVVFSEISANHTLYGNATHLGLIDPAQSASVVLDCDINPAMGTVTLLQETTFMNSNGDGLKFLGSGVLNMQTHMGTGYYEVVEGYGKFLNASGWAETLSQQTETGTMFSADGMVTQPNH